MRRCLILIGTSKPIISAFQLSLLLVTNRIAVMTVFLPVITTMGSSRDIWIASLLSGCGGLVITNVIVRLCRNYPDQNLVQICETVLGKWLGRLIGWVFLWFFLHISIIFTRQFAETINNALMPETPVLAFVIVMTVAVIYCTGRGLEAIVRVNQITLPITIFSLLMIIVLNKKIITLTTLLPILEFGWEPVLFASIVPTAKFGEAIIIAMLYPRVRDKENVLRYSIAAILFCTFVLLSLSIATLCAFGPEEAKDLSLPLFTLSRMVSVAQFVERIEVLMVGVWISLFLIKICSYLYVGVVGTAEWLRLRENKFLLLPLGTTSMILSVQSFDSLPDLFHFLTPSHFGYYALAIVFGLPVMLLSLSFFKKGLRYHE